MLLGKKYFFSGNNKKCHHLAVGGQSIRQLTRRLKKGRQDRNSMWATNFAGKNAIVLVGLINVLNNDKKNTITTQLKHLITELRGHSPKKIFFCTLPECKELNVKV